MGKAEVVVHKKIARLRAIRKRLGWSEETCAHELGVTYSTLNRWERGESRPKSRLVLAAIDRFISTHRNDQIGRG
jgi:transcriptional regulator with XRE-family HTH domain